MTVKYSPPPISYSRRVSALSGARRAAGSEGAALEEVREGVYPPGAEQREWLREQDGFGQAPLPERPFCLSGRSEF